jgi:hypothetical protein
VNDLPRLLQKAALKGDVAIGPMIDEHKRSCPACLWTKCSRVIPNLKR